MIKMIEHLHEPWGIKDCQSRHLFMNKAARLYTCTPTAFDLEGRLDCEFPAMWAEQAEGFIEHDRQAESEGKRVSVIETDFWFGRKELHPYISEKIPFRDANGVCLGTLWNARKIKVLSPYVCISDKKTGRPAYSVRPVCLYPFGNGYDFLSDEKSESERSCKPSWIVRENHQ